MKSQLWFRLYQEVRGRKGMGAFLTVLVITFLLQANAAGVDAKGKKVCRMNQVECDALGWSGRSAAAAGE
jgi:hypothetical protein